MLYHLRQETVFPSCTSARARTHSGNPCRSQGCEPNKEAKGIAGGNNSPAKQLPRYMCLNTAGRTRYQNKNPHHCWWKSILCHISHITYYIIWIKRLVDSASALLLWDVLTLFDSYTLRWPHMFENSWSCLNPSAEATLSICKNFNVSKAWLLAILNFYQ